MTVLSTSSPGAVVVTVIGEVDMSVTDCLRTSLFEALTTASRAMIIDLSMVSFASAAMLRVLVEVTAAARAAGVGCAIVSDQHAVRRIIHLAGLDPVLRPWPSLASAEYDLAHE
jgi:anti-anti-sigma factor